MLFLLGIILNGGHLSFLIQLQVHFLCTTQLIMYTPGSIRLDFFQKTN